MEYAKYTGPAQGGCQCGGASCTGSEVAGLQRTRFFQGQLVMPDDLTQDQVYFRDKHLRHNRMLHGWGVVCGARVMRHPTDPCKVRIEPGYVLGPFGHEILIDTEIEVDLCKEGVDGNAVSPCSGAADPWCADIRVNRPAGLPLYIAIAYAECAARPVRAHGHGCGCNESECEYSRIQDSFAIRVLTALPASYADPMPQPDSESVVRCATDANRRPIARACPPCPPEPWVVLADVTLADDGSVRDVDCFAHRRYVASFADFYYLCTTPAVAGDSIRDVYVDVAIAAQPAAVQPQGLVRTFRADGTTAYLPLYFEVNAGESVRSLLEREGAREFVDPQTNERFTLADLFAMAGVDPAASLRNTVDAGSHLDGITVRVGDLGRTRTTLRGLLDDTGVAELEATHANAPAAVETLPGTALRGVGPRSALGRKVAGMSVGDIASRERSAFVREMAEDAAANRRGAIEAQAGDAWDVATEVTRISRAWRT